MYLAQTWALRRTEELVLVRTEMTEDATRISHLARSHDGV